MRAYHFMYIKNKFSPGVGTFSMFAIVIVLLISPASGFTQGNLIVTPKRVVFENTKRSEEMNIANTGKDTATFLITFIQIRMKDDGTFEKIEQPDSAQQFADKYLRLYPRSVTLGPNEAQTVKLQLRRTKEMVPGEYRSHLYFRAVPNQKPLGDNEQEQDGISVRLIPIFGISIPVIIHVGESDTKVSFSDVSLLIQHDSVPVLKMTFNRKGNMSVYGDVSVEHISMKGKKTQIGTVKGLAVYSPNTSRHFNLMLSNMSAVDHRSGKLHLVYADQSARPVILAEEEIELGALQGMLKN